MTASRCYAEAAESALLRFSPSQTITSRSEQWRFFQRSRSVACARSSRSRSPRCRGQRRCKYWPGSIEAKRAYQRAQSLLDDAPLHPLRGLFLHGLGLILWMRGELDEANALPSAATPFPLPLQITQRCFARAWYTEWLNTRAAGRDWRASGSKEHRRSQERRRKHVTCAVRCRSDRSCLGLLAVNLLHLGSQASTHTPARGARACTSATPARSATRGALVRESRLKYAWATPNAWQMFRSSC